MSILSIVVVATIALLFLESSTWYSHTVALISVTSWMAILLWFPRNSVLTFNKSFFAIDKVNLLIPYSEVSDISIRRFVRMHSVVIHTYAKNYFVADFPSLADAEQFVALINQFWEQTP